MLNRMRRIRVEARGPGEQPFPRPSRLALDEEMGRAFRDAVGLKVPIGKSGLSPVKHREEPMPSTSSGSSDTSLIAAGSIIRKISFRIIPFLFALYVINYIDRINIGFAALSMNKDLGLTATMFGLANAVFYVGYVVCEVPSNLLMARFGARVWLSRIMISWGLASAATMLVLDANSLYVVRFLVGIMEAGFAPGILLYLTYWFPDSSRARANGLLMMAQPVAMAIGAGLSGLILQHVDGVGGLQGWRWMFLLEGLPATILGVAALFYLTDRPETSSWLKPSEVAALNSLLDRHDAEKSAARPIWSQLRDKRVVMLALAYFCLVNTLNANSTWIPTIVRDVLKSYSQTSVGFITAIPAISALILMPVWTFSSDHTRERRGHVVAALALAAVGWLIVIYAERPELRLLGMIFTTSGGFCAMSVFWTLPQAFLSEAARPAGIGLISAVGLLGSAVSPTVVGYLRDLTGNFAAGLFYVSALLVVGAVLVLVASSPRYSLPHLKETLPSEARRPRLPA
jgi:MFS transporter, ACS family, 4-hydroxyphenylacetate permease